MTARAFQATDLLALNCFSVIHLLQDRSIINLYIQEPYTVKCNAMKQWPKLLEQKVTHSRILDKTDSLANRTRQFDAVHQLCTDRQIGICICHVTDLTVAMTAACNFRHSFFHYPWEHTQWIKSYLIESTEGVQNNQNTLPVFQTRKCQWSVLQFHW